jgi:hypothetical protein|tara:strand:- start:5192 stop:5794 length:603 start_codon:yes stop_codon:yes gene_type:complete
VCRCERARESLGERVEVYSKKYISGNIGYRFATGALFFSQRSALLLGRLNPEELEDGARDGLPVVASDTTWEGGRFAAAATARAVAVAASGVFSSRKPPSSRLAVNVCDPPRSPLRRLPPLLFHRRTSPSLPIRSSDLSDPTDVSDPPDRTGGDPFTSFFALLDSIFVRFAAKNGANTTASSSNALNTGTKMNVTANKSK